MIVNHRAGWAFVAALPLLLATLARAQATTQPTGDPAAPASAQQTMNDLLSNRNRGTALPSPTATSDGPTLDVGSGNTVVAPGAGPVNLMREGTFIVNRTGRLTHAADGQQMEFTFDGDRRAMKDPPLLILPNLKLMQMESAVNGQSRDLRFRVSGTVTEYRGRNYILLDKVVVMADIDNDL